MLPNKSSLCFWVSANSVKATRRYVWLSMQFVWHSSMSMSTKFVCLSMGEYFNSAHIRFFRHFERILFQLKKKKYVVVSSERRIRGWSYRKTLPLGAWTLLSTTTEFLSTMKVLQDTMMESRCDTIYNGTTFNGFLECGSRFTLRLKTAKSTNYIEKCLRQKQSKIKFSTKKKQWAHISTSPRSRARGLQRLEFPFWCLILQK